jgi:glycerophosphoryl diester phosphodiesterase
MFATVLSPFNMAEKMEFDRMASYGIEPWAGAGVRDEAGVDAAIACGATLITCNNPDVILDLLRKKGYHK